MSVEEKVQLEKGHLDELTLSLLVDDMLDGKETDRCYQHMTECRECEVAFENLQAISFAMAKLEDVAPPSDFTARVMGQLPPQDQVDSSKTVEIKEHRVKKSFLANLNLTQAVGFAAAIGFCVLSLGMPPSLEETPRSGGGEMSTPVDSTTMTLGEGLEESGRISGAMPMEMEDLGTSAVAFGLSEDSLDTLIAYDLGESWIVDGTPFAAEPASLLASDSRLAAVVENYCLEEGLESPDVVLFARENPDVTLFSSVKTGERAVTGGSYQFSLSEVSLEGWDDSGNALLETFPALSSWAGMKPRVLLVYRS